MTYRPYGNLYDRLIANTAEPINERSCWPWTAKCDRSHYPRFNLYVPSLGVVVTLMAHIALYVWLEAKPASIDEFYDMYVTVVASGMEIDHVCNWRDCMNPDHHELVTASENCKRRDLRKKDYGR